MTPLQEVYSNIHFLSLDLFGSELDDSSRESLTLSGSPCSLSLSFLLLKVRSSLPFQKYPNP